LYNLLIQDFDSVKICLLSLHTLYLNQKQQKGENLGGRAASSDQSLSE
jgi:hypothetical protein